MTPHILLTIVAGFMGVAAIADRDARWAGAACLALALASLIGS